MSAESPFLRVRVSPRLLAAIAKQAKRGKITPSEFARRALAEAAGDPELAEMRAPGRPEKPEKTKEK